MPLVLPSTLPTSIHRLFLPFSLPHTLLMLNDCTWTLPTAIPEEGFGNHQVPQGGGLLQEPARPEACGHLHREVVPPVSRPQAVRVHEKGREGGQGKERATQRLKGCLCLRICFFSSVGQ